MQLSVRVVYNYAPNIVEECTNSDTTNRKASNGEDKEVALIIFGSIFQLTLSDTDFVLVENNVTIVLNKAALSERAI